MPYLYYLEHQFCDFVVILHDSVFLNSKLDTDSVQDYRFIWSFRHNWDSPQLEIPLLQSMPDSEELCAFYEKKHLWLGCFGGMSCVRHDFLRHVDRRYPLSSLIPLIRCRQDRMGFERVIACLFQIVRPFSEQEVASSSLALFGDIIQYYPWGIKFSHLPILKVWTGR